MHYLKVMRPHQWIKNFMLFFPPFLGGLLVSFEVVARGVEPFLAFCLSSSAVYVFNDIIDREADSHHAVKCKRAIAYGQLSIAAACIFATFLVLCSIALGSAVSTPFLMFLAAYIVVSVSYSLWFKHIPIVDLFSISALFLIRLMAGGEAFDIRVSEWLFLSVFLLALFLSTGKRLCEKNILGDAAAVHRKVLMRYPTGFLDGVMYMTAGTLLVTYTMYVISHKSLVYTVPLCYFGLLRYLFRAQSGLGGDPTESLLKDLPLLLTALLWVVSVGWVIYF